MNIAFCSFLGKAPAWAVQLTLTPDLILILGEDLNKNCHREKRKSQYLVRFMTFCSPAVTCWVQ